MSEFRLDRIEERLGALVERRETKRSLGSFAKWASDPVGFFRDVLHVEPWEAQRLIAEAVRDHPFVVVRSCNGAGKDFTAAGLALWWVYAHRGLVLITGPTERQAKQVVMGEVHRFFAKAKTLPGELFEMALRVDRAEQAGILAYTSSDMNKLTGFHAASLMVIITEAQGLAPFAWEGLLACATGANSRVLAVGNPLSPTGKFYDISRSEHWQSFRISALDHPNVVQQREVIPGAVTQTFIDTMAREYGLGSGQYRARVEGEFPDEADDTLVKRSWCDAAVERWSDDVDESDLGLALDVARFGADSSVLAVRKGTVLQDLIVWSKTDLMESVGRVYTELDRLGITPGSYAPRAYGSSIGRIVSVDGPTITVDEIGVGSGVLDRLRERIPYVHGFNGGRAPVAPTAAVTFLNARAEAFWGLRRLLEEGVIALPHDPKLFDELCALRWKVNSAGKIQIESKDDFRSRIGRSCDRADAVAMLFYRYEPPVASPRRRFGW